MKDYTIGSKPLKISCLQVKPGYEFELARDIEKKARDIGIHSVKCFKGFGLWDLILIYEQAADFGPLLTQAGPIKGILNSTTFLCFDYSINENVDSLLDDLSKFIFCGLIFIKLKIKPGVSVPVIEENTINLIKNKITSKWYLLGTIGWNEYILITLSNEFGQLASELFELNIYSEEDGRAPDYIKKTFSVLSINHLWLSKIEESNAEFGKIEDQLEKHLGKENLPSLIHATIYAASETEYYKSIINYWEEFKGEFKLQICYGEFDFCINLIEGKSLSWSRFLSTLICFRQRFKDQLCMTNTIFGYNPNFENQSQDTSNHIEQYCQLNENPLPFDFPYKELEDTFSHQMASVLCHHFYRLNALSQHPLIGDCFKALFPFPKTCIKDAKVIKADYEKSDSIEASDAVQYMAIQAALTLSLGMELRLYGTYTNIQKNYFHFGTLGGGVQRSLLAMEFFPKYIFHTYNSTWEGFIICQDPKFAHIRDNIFVPTDSLWFPNKWWAIYHEIAHVLIDRAEWIHESKEAVQSFLNQTLPLVKKDALDLLNEIAAEIIGFEFGFFGDLDLFKKLLWEHLLDIESKVQAPMDFWFYFIRTFCVELYDRRFKKEKEDYSITDEHFDKRDFLWETFLAHINDIKKIIEANRRLGPKLENIFKYAKTHAAVFISYFQHLLPFFKYLNDLHKHGIKRDGQGFCPNISGLDGKSTIKAIDNISKGLVYWDKINHPEAVLYHFLKINNNIDTAQNMALILTFWNAAIQLEEVK